MKRKITNKKQINQFVAYSLLVYAIKMYCKIRKEEI